MTTTRRHFLRGLGGVTVSLPLLEGLRPATVRANDPDVPPFAIFLRQANGVAAAQDTDEIGAEPERFWPSELGALTEANTTGRALDELSDHLQRLLVWFEGCTETTSTTATVTRAVPSRV